MARYLEDWIPAYMEYSRYSEAPDKFHWWTAVSCVAGALQGKVDIHQGYFRWPANFYIVFVAPPGIVQKSTTISIGTDLLLQVPGIVPGPDVVTWQALVTAFTQATVGQLMEDGSFEPHSSMSIASSEFGNLLNPSDREMVDFLVSMWDGQKKNFKKLTKTSGNDLIQNPWLNLIACTTPSWIAGNFPEYLIGGGFTSRTIFVYGEEKRALVAYPGQVIPEGHVERRTKLIHDLELISQFRGQFSLTREALAYGEIWYKDHYENNIKKPQNEFVSGYFARKQTHLHKLAMVLSASRRNTMQILPEDLRDADIELQKIEADMPKVFSKIGLTVETQAIELLLDTIRRERSMSQTAAYRLFHRKVTQQQFNEVMKSCALTGHVKLHVGASATGPEVFLSWIDDEPVS